LISLRTVVSLACKPAAGWASDRFGVRTVYLAGSLVRILSVAGLLFADTYALLIAVRALQGASAAARDVASLGVIARDAQNRVGTVYSWYSSAKHVGGVAGAGVAGLIIAASGGGYQTLFVIVLILSILPTAAAWIGLREVSDEEVSKRSSSAEPETGTQSEPAEESRKVGTFSLLRELSGPASVGMLVAASAYMVHGIFPVLATEYAGLSAAQAGLIYSLSAVVFLVAGPVFGWLVDTRGRLIGIAWRSAANIGSSFLYLISPTFAGLAAARSVDDSGKAAFRPAWASAIAEISAKDPPRRGQRLGALDTSQTVGEAIGPALAGLLWQTGGIAALFGVRIVIAIVAELAALSVFGELRGRRLRPSPAVTAVAYLLPPTLTFTIVAVWLGKTSGWGVSPISATGFALGVGVFLSGLLAGVFVGRAAAAAERRAIAEKRDGDLDTLAHDLRAPIAVIRGEVELVLSQEDTAPEQRQRSSETVTDEVDQIDHLLRRRHTR